jgi:heme-degrading monooxygenase HmoA
MFARVTTYEIDAARMDEAATVFRAALEQIGTFDGFIEGFFFVAPEEDRAISTTLWSTRDALEASRTAASRLRSEAAGSVEGSILSAVEYDVSAHIGAAGHLLTERP